MLVAVRFSKLAARSLIDFGRVVLEGGLRELLRGSGDECIGVGSWFSPTGSSLGGDRTVILCDGPRKFDSGRPDFGRVFLTERESWMLSMLSLCLKDTAPFPHMC